MNKEKLELKHGALLYDRLKELNLTISEYSFANLFLFRSAHEYEVVTDREIFISGITYDGVRYAMPTSDIRTMDREYFKRVLEEFGMVFPVPEEWLGAFDSGDYKVRCSDGDMDYVYTAEKISTYKGKKLHKKRNLLYQFYDLYEHKAVPLTLERRDDARKILREWQADSGQAVTDTDYNECMEAIDLQDELRLCGGIYYADEEPAGFIIGEEINSDMFALHFAKGLKKVKGIYQFMYNNCAQVLHAQYTYLNFEQDLEKLPLRQAKASYIPDLMIKKYRIMPE
jgi:hypothetical protein